MIYFDNSATTSLHPEVLEAMLPYLNEEYGNPSSKYYSLAENAKKATDIAREQVAALLGCRPDEVIFTSGATESNNMVIKGVADFYQTKGNYIITTPTEHPSVLETVKFLESKGYQVTYLDVDKFGRVCHDQLSSILKEQSPILVSILWGNNEIGSLNNIDAISNLCQHHKVFLHTDATQVLGKVNIDLDQQNVTFLSCSAHKIHGPKGIGACIIRKNLGTRTKITPLLHGGGQESEYRSGTLSVHNIVGFGKAAEIAKNTINSTISKLQNLEGILVKEIKARFPDLIIFNSDDHEKIPGVINLRFKGVNNELLIKKLAPYAAVSTGSACSSSKPSHVLSAIGLSQQEIRETVRISLSRFNTENDVSDFLNLLS